jgi:hypothetical protein
MGYDVGVRVALCLILAFVGATRAMALGAETPVPAGTAPEPAPPERQRVLVLEPSSAAFDAATVATIAGLIIVELSADKRLDVISASEVRRLAELEGERQTIGCNDTSCLAELAGAMGARYVVFGDVGTLGSLVVMNLNLFDGATTQAISRVTVQSDGIGGLPAALPARIKVLAEPLIARMSANGTTTTTTTTATATTATVGDATAPVVAEGGSAAPWIVLSSGVALVVVGGLVDGFSPTSSNGEVDPVDFVGPVGYVGGVVVAVVGLGMLVFGGSSNDAP